MNQSQQVAVIDSAEAAKPFEITLRKHSVILLVGPTGSGKSTFAEELAYGLAYGPDVASNLYNVRLISSDYIRRELLDWPADTHQHSGKMLQVSRQAFDLLFAQLKAYISYPVNADFVIVDTRGFDANFRKEVVSIASQNGYSTTMVVFDYKRASDYLSLNPTPEERPIIEADVRRFRRKVLPEIRVRDCDQRIKISKPIPMDPNRIAIPPEPSRVKVNVQGDYSYKLAVQGSDAVAVIGDSHECVDELQELVDRVASKHGEATKFIHVGDYLDKGGDTRRMVDYMMDFHGRGHTLIRGNHENYVYLRLTGKTDANPELEADYFTSLEVLLADPVLAAKFKFLYENSWPACEVTHPMSRTLHITHAPCEEKYLMKAGALAERSQRNFYFKNREADAREELGFIFKEAEMSKPIHIFGHVAHNSDTPVYKNKVFLDTGSVHGGKLTAFVMKDDRYEFISVNCRQRVAKGVDALPTNLTKPVKEERRFNIHDYDLSPQDQRLVRQVMRNGIKYISGTMPPAPSTKDELEPLQAAFDYYAKRGVTDLVLQPKYMGSRCQMYLFKDPEKESFCVSRNGWKIRPIDGLEVLIATKKEEYKSLFNDSIILDGELLPWSALGRGLIEDQFESYGALVAKELITLANDSEFAQLVGSEDYDVMGRLNDSVAFNNTLELYSQDKPLDYKAFDILSVDGRVNAESAGATFESINSDDYLGVKTDAPAAVTLAHNFYKTLSVDWGMEGVVVKPRLPQEGLLPYMKVRNPEYLRLVYGYDYGRRLGQLIYQKNISGKAASAVKEHRMAVQMLTADDAFREELTVKMIGELAKEAAFDPRL